MGAGKDSTAEVRTAPRGVSTGNLNWYLDQTTTYFTLEPSGSAEKVCVALGSGRCHFLTLFFSMYKAFFKYKTPVLPATSSCVVGHHGLQLLAPSVHPSEEHPLGDFWRLSLTTHKNECGLACGFLTSIVFASYCQWQTWSKSERSSDWDLHTVSLWSSSVILKDSMVENAIKRLPGAKFSYKLTSASCSPQKRFTLSQLKYFNGTLLWQLRTRYWSTLNEVVAFFQDKLFLY